MGCVDSKQTQPKQQSQKHQVKSSTLECSIEYEMNYNVVKYGRKFMKNDDNDFMENQLKMIQNAQSNQFWEHTDNKLQKQQKQNNSDNKFSSISIMEKSSSSTQYSNQKVTSNKSNNNNIYYSQQF